MARNKKVPFKPWESLKENGIEVRFTRLAETQMLHPNFRSLSPSATKIYIQMKLEANGNLGFEFPVSKYKDFIDKNTFQRAKAELIEKGFIEEVQNNKNLRKSNKYQFSKRWKDL